MTVKRHWDVLESLDKILTPFLQWTWAKGALTGAWMNDTV